MTVNMDSSTGNHSGSIHSSSSCDGDGYDSSSHGGAVTQPQTALVETPALASSLLNHREQYHQLQQHKMIDYNLSAPRTCNDEDPFANSFDTTTMWSAGRAEAKIRSPSNAGNSTPYDENHSINPPQNQTNSSSIPIIRSNNKNNNAAHSLHQPPPVSLSHHQRAAATPKASDRYTSRVTSSNQNKPAAAADTIVDSSNSSTGGSRNPKKRPRVSKRAPTTVLTTDTTNFRAMVQEFTGVPSPPFLGAAATSSFLFPRTSRRLDLSGSSTVAAPTQHLPTRPFPKTYSTLPFVSSSAPFATTMASNNSSTAEAAAEAEAAAAAAAAIMDTGDPDASRNSNNNNAYDDGSIRPSNSIESSSSRANYYQQPWDHALSDYSNLQRAKATGLSFSASVQQDSSYPSRANPAATAGSSLDIPVKEGSSTTGAIIINSSRLETQIGFGGGHDSGSFPTMNIDLMGAINRINNNNNNNNSSADMSCPPHHNHNHHHQRPTHGATLGMNTIESLLCSSSTSTG